MVGVCNGVFTSRDISPAIAAVVTKASNAENSARLLTLQKLVAALMFVVDLLCFCSLASDEKYVGILTRLAERLNCVCNRASHVAAQESIVVSLHAC